MASWDVVRRRLEHELTTLTEDVLLVRRVTYGVERPVPAPVAS